MSAHLKNNSRNQKDKEQFHHLKSYKMRFMKVLIPLPIFNSSAVYTLYPSSVYLGPSKNN